MSHFFPIKNALSLLPIGLLSLSLFAVPKPPAALAGQAVKPPKQHPCLQKLTLLDTSSTISATWRPLGLIIEPLATRALNEQRRTATKTWLTTQASLSIYAAISKKTQPSRSNPSLFLINSDANEQSSLQEHLLTLGLARVDITNLASPCAKTLLIAEEAARKNRKGLWQNKAYAIQKADDLHLLDKISTYQIIKGKVKSVSRNPRKISYLNFGHVWKRDFTVTLSAKLLKIWEKQGHSLDELQGQTVYVRGWIENRDGALVHIKHPQQLHYQESKQ
ncbi:MAG: thermonuclease family protein [Cohaesibacter sp.]|nr:thermonuclease family protein [Cohaesibacter sp.]